HFEEGDSVEAYAIELDETNKNITLSQRDQDVKKATSRKKKSRSEDKKTSPQTGTPTLGEMSGLADLKEQMAAKERAEAAEKLQEAARKSSEEEEGEEEDNDEQE